MKLTISRKSALACLDTIQDATKSLLELEKEVRSLLMMAEAWEIEDDVPIIPEEIINSVLGEDE